MGLIISLIASGSFVMTAFGIFGEGTCSFSGRGGARVLMVTVYNDGSGQSAPTWLTPNDPNVIAVPHEVLWSVYGDMTGHPSANRNAIAALLHHIPGYVIIFRFS